MAHPPRLADHPTVKAVRARTHAAPPAVIDAGWLRELCLAAGADDVAFAAVDNPELASEREHVEAALPGTRSYISLVVRMNRDNVRSTARSVANQEFHRSGEVINEAAHRITRALEEAGHRALNPSATFPMEMDRYPGRIWVVAHKPVPGQRLGERLDVAEPVVQGQLQSGLLPGGLPGGRGRHRALPR